MVGDPHSLDVVIPEQGSVGTKFLGFKLFTCLIFKYLSVWFPFLKIKIVPGFFLSYLIASHIDTSLTNPKIGSI